MADITMCQNETCLSKSTCWRFTATPNQYWQSYCYFGEKDNLKCGEYKNDRKSIKMDTPIGFGM